MGSRVNLRAFEWEDARAYRHWINDIEIAEFLDRVLPVTEEEHRRWYEQIIASPQAVIFAVDVLPEKHFIGAIWLWNINFRHSTAEVRILIGEKGYWGKGLGTEALQLLVRFAFERLHLHKLYAYVLSSNGRAIRAFEKAGFVKEACYAKEKFVAGRFVDLVRLACFKEG